MSNDLDTPLTITWSDVATEGRAGKLSYGDVLTMRELLFPLLIESSNDAGSAIARGEKGAFSRAVSSVIQTHALASTTIREPTGLSRENVSTVTDLARFYAFLYEDHTHLIDITTLHMYLGKQHGWANSDPLSARPDFRGGKNGYTPEAGRTFVGSFERPDGTGAVGIVVLGSSDLTGDVNALLENL